MVRLLQPTPAEVRLHVRPWRDLQGTDRKLRIGILHDDGVVKPVTPIRRALDFAVAQLRKSERFEVVDYTPILGREAWDIIVRHTTSHEWPTERPGEVVLA